MPSKSKAQHNFMEAIAHNKAFAEKVHVPQSVGRDFAEADKGKHFKKGGINMATKKRSVNPAMAMMAARAMPTPSAAPAAQPPVAPAMGGMKHGGLSKEHHKHLAHHHLEMAEHHMHMHKGTHKMAHGGKTESTTEPRGHFKEKESMGTRNMKSDVEKGSNKLGKFGESKVEKRGHTEDREPKMKGNTIGTGALVNTKKHGGHIKKMAHGGATSGRADGIAQRGHTKTKYC